VARAAVILDFLRVRGRTYRYGSDRSQQADLHLPDGEGPHPVMVLIHGGSWRARYGKSVMRALASDLLERGWAVWNIEYRRVGNGGGWPATLSDVAGAIDHLAQIEAPVDLRRMSVTGHSAGGQLALWAAGRQKLAPGAPGASDGPLPVAFAQVISLAGVCDLAGAYRLSHGGATGDFMGGSPEQLPDRYLIADPMAQLPLSVPALLVHGVNDMTVSIKLSRNYARAALAAGSSVELVEIEGEAGGHRTYIDPRSAGWREVTARLMPGGQG
jgi:acetyl esterase/lipase